MSHISTQNMKSGLEAFLQYYCQKSNPRYAIMITGEWGIGKTYQVKKTIKRIDIPKTNIKSKKLSELTICQLFLRLVIWTFDEIYKIVRPAGKSRGLVSKSGERIHYISLYGLKSTNDIYAAILSSLLSEKSWLARLISPISKFSYAGAPVGEMMSGIMQSAVPRILPNGAILIIDDVERYKHHCDALGVVNVLLTSGKCNVILIGNDEGIENKFRDGAEKVIGSTLRLTPQVEEALDVFLVEARNIFETIINFREIILDVFKQSDVKTLRALRQAVMETAKLLSCVDTEFLTSEKYRIGLTQTVQFFLFFKLKCINGDVGAANLREYIRKCKEAGDGLPNSMRNYIGNFIHNEVFNEEINAGVIDKIFVYLDYDPEFINNILKKSSIFSTDDPTWWHLYQYQLLSNKLFCKYLQRLKRELSEKSITKTADILHTFAILLILANFEVISKSQQSIKDCAFEYIKKISDEGLLEPAGWNHNWDDDFASAASGYAYYYTDSTEHIFKEIFTELKRTREKLRDTIAKHAVIEDILALLEGNDLSRLQSKLCYVDKYRAKEGYQYIGILHFIPVGRFIDVWLNRPVEDWPKVLDILEERYRLNFIRQPSPDWVNEAAWAADVLSGLKDAKIKTSSNMDKMRIDWLIRRMSYIIGGDNN